MGRQTVIDNPVCVFRRIERTISNMVSNDLSMHTHTHTHTHTPTGRRSRRLRRRSDALQSVRTARRLNFAINALNYGRVQAIDVVFSVAIVCRYGAVANAYVGGQVRL
jgi:hypothetical protein